MNSPPSNTELTDPPNVCLVGAGVVGRAIANAHIDAGVSFSIADQSEDALREAVSEWRLNVESWRVSPVIQLGQCLPAIQLVSTRKSPESSTLIVIESIAERLDVKRDFFAEAEQIFGDDTILCSNTSTLRIGAIAEKLKRPERFCGMHFFMPVEKRDAVEVIRGEQTADSTVQVCRDHVRRIQKEPLAVGDGPGFVVNRLLSPYLNEAMLMLGRGVTADRIERAALAYGMPMSPLELIDLIGTRTTFDAGRVFWQSFPTRIDPSPILPAMLKHKRFGRSWGRGFYDYTDGRRGPGLAAETITLCEKYSRDQQAYSDDDVQRILAVSMWIEAACLLREGTAANLNTLETAMAGGLGYTRPGDWLAYFDRLGRDAMLLTLQGIAGQRPALVSPPGLVDHLSSASTVGEAMKRFVGKPNRH